ncbi:MAG: hypothetical protein LBR35_01425 [Rickettsiales bacterium]|jgi:hypothetical protein|nr:hypothetical protein [Rickettsiales bacterium]
MNDTAAGTNTDAKWLLKNFNNINRYIEETLKVISAVCVMKDNIPIEKYENIGFLYDLFDYQIANGEKILKRYDDKDISEYIKGGKAEVSDILKKIKSKKINEFLDFKNTFDEVGDFGDLSSRDLQDRINKMLNSTIEEKPLQKTEKKKPVDEANKKQKA